MLHNLTEQLNLLTTQRGCLRWFCRHDGDNPKLEFYRCKQKDSDEIFWNLESLELGESRRTFGRSSSS
jgi:hypothetical protein